MMIRFTSRRRDRGSFMLGFAALTVILALACGSALMRSLETYHSSGLAVKKLQARAAAEGAAVAWSRGALETSKPLQVGECLATVDSVTSNTTGQTVRLTVAVYPGASKTAALISHFSAGATQSTAGSRRIDFLEQVP